MRTAHKERIDSYKERGRIRLNARALFLSNTAEERAELPWIASTYLVGDERIRKSKRQPKLRCRHQETVDCSIQLIFHKRGARAGDDTRALFLSNTAEERAEFSGSVPIASSSTTSAIGYAKFFRPLT